MIYHLTVIEAIHHPLPLLHLGGPVEAEVGVAVETEEMLQDVEHPSEWEEDGKTYINKIIYIVYYLSEMHVFSCSMCIYIGNNSVYE